MQEQTGRKEVVAWADLIRVVAIYLVVLVHVSGQLTGVWGTIPKEQWIIANVYGGIARICVPLFFMISGYLLLPRSESLRVFYTKRIPKILIPLVVWSLFYLGWYCGGHPNTCDAGFVWNLLLFQGTFYHLWFLYTLLGIYISLPVLRLLVRPDTDKQLLWYLIGLWLIFQGLLPTANKFWDFKINLSAPLAGGYVCFFVLGYLLGEVPLSRLKVSLAAVIWVISTLVTIIGTYLLIRNSGQFDGFFYDFVSPSVMLATGAAFILLRQISETKLFSSATAQGIVRVLATSAFGIYLIHALFIEVLSDWIPFLHINSFMGNAIWSVPLVSTLVFLLSFLIVRLMQKVPVLKQIVP